jgi:hypothetical protein
VHEGRRGEVAAGEGGGDGAQVAAHLHHARRVVDGALQLDAPAIGQRVEAMTDVVWSTPIARGSAPRAWTAAKALSPTGAAASRGRAHAAASTSAVAAYGSVEAAPGHRRVGDVRAMVRDMGDGGWEESARRSGAPTCLTLGCRVAMRSDGSLTAVALLLAGDRASGALSARPAVPPTP